MIHFTVTEQHIRILYLLDFGYGVRKTSESQAPITATLQIDEICNGLDFEAPYSDEQKQKAQTIYNGLAYALQIFLCCGKIEPGEYYSVMNHTDWVRVKP